MSNHSLQIAGVDVDTIYQPASNAKAVVVFAHGAGAGMGHSTLQAIADALETHHISTFRFNFPYMQQGKNRVDSNPVACEAIQIALERTQELSAGPYYLGGHSFGGRMASHAVVDLQLEVAGLIFCSFPLHTPKNVHTKRADHMDAISAPMLFLSGTRDGMASPDLMTEVTNRLGANLIWLETADHGYKVLKRTRQRTDDVFTEMAGYISSFIDDTSTRA